MASKRVDVIKFPRTRHLFNAGGTGVSRDDLLMDSGEENLFYSDSHKGSKAGKHSKPSPQTIVCIEEKVDGANLGISLGDDMQLRVQNRSHFVNSQTHRQFSTLDSWLSEHSGELYELLDDGNNILFGEWLYAKHSIHYTRLPGYFMAFDLYNTKEEKFYSWRERNRRLKDTTIPVVRQIDETALSGREELLRYLETASVFYDGPCEGLYLRMDEDSTPGGAPYCRHRGKLVRPDFLQGIEEQWTRQKLTKNIIRY